MLNSVKDLIRIVILDKFTLIRAGLRYIVESQPDMRVVGEAGNPGEMLNLIASQKPDIILFELDPAGGLTLDVIPDLIKTWNRVHMILVTSSQDSEISLQAVHKGVVGVVLKTQPPEVLIKAIRKVHLGEVWLEHALIANLLASFTQGQPAFDVDPDADRIAELSDRERHIIQWIGRGLKNKQIAVDLCISETTVRHHLTSIYRKLEVSDRLELLVFAHRCGLT